MTPWRTLGPRHAALALALAVISLVPVGLLLAAVPPAFQALAGVVLLEGMYGVVAVVALAPVGPRPVLDALGRPAPWSVVGFAVAGCGTVVLNALWSTPLYDPAYTEQALAMIEATAAVLGTPGLVVLMGLLAPACEELLFRGVVLSGLRARWGDLPAVALSAIAFGLAHVHPIHAAVATVLGLFCGLARVRAGLWAALAVHVGNNLVGLWLALAGPDLGLTAGVVGTLLLVGGTVVGVWRTGGSVS